MTELFAGPSYTYGLVLFFFSFFFFFVFFFLFFSCFFFFFFVCVFLLRNGDIRLSFLSMVDVFVDFIYSFFFLVIIR